MSKLLSLVVVAVLVVPVVARAQTAPAAPTGDEFKKVLEYFNGGKDSGPVLGELKPCMKVDTTKGSPTFLDCVELATGKVKKGAVVNAWMNWLVPKDGKYEEGISVQWLHEGVVRTTQDLTLKIPGIGIRTYLALTAGKSGKWEIKVMSGAKELGSGKFEVE